MFTYHLSETEYLVFKTYNNYFELFSGHEGGAELKKIANYKGGKWNFDSYDQQKLFWFLFTMFKADFGKAIRRFSKSLDERPKTYVFVCAKRRFDVKVQKMKRGWNNWFYNLYEGNRRG